MPIGEGGVNLPCQVFFWWSIKIRGELSWRVREAKGGSQASVQGYMQNDDHAEVTTVVWCCQDHASHCQKHREAWRGERTHTVAGNERPQRGARARSRYK
jgi:hypothetical protein